MYRNVYSLVFSNACLETLNCIANGWVNRTCLHQLQHYFGSAAGSISSTNPKLRNRGTVALLTLPPRQAALQSENLL